MQRIRDRNTLFANDHCFAQICALFVSRLFDWVLLRTDWQWSKVQFDFLREGVKKVLYLQKDY